MAAKIVRYSKRGLKKRPQRPTITPATPPQVKTAQRRRYTVAPQIQDERQEAIQQYKGRVKPIKTAPPQVAPTPPPVAPTPPATTTVPPPVSTTAPVQTTSPTAPLSPIGTPMIGPGATAPPTVPGEVIGQTPVPGPSVISGIPMPTIQSSYGSYWDMIDYVDRITGRVSINPQTGEELVGRKPHKPGLYPEPWYMPSYNEEHNPNKFNPGYEPSFWEDPRNVAMVYHGVIGIDNVQWADKEFVKQAYDYFKLANGTDEWTSWKYLAPGDPARGWLQTGQQPPLDYILPPKEYQNVLYNAIVALPPEQRDPRLIEKLTPGYRAALQYEELVRYYQRVGEEFTPEWFGLAKSLTSDPAISSAIQMGALGLFTLNPVAALGMAAFGYATGAASKISDPFWASVAGTAAMGAMLGMATTPVFGPLGVIGGAAVGAIAGGLTNYLSRGTDWGGVTGYNLTDGLMQLMDMPAEGLEALIGTGALLYNAAKDPKTFGTPSELLGDLHHTLQAGRLVYTVASVPNQNASGNWINIFPWLGYTWAKITGDEEELKKIRFAKPGETFNLSGDNPFPYAIGASQAAMLNAARKRILAGENVDKILLEYQYLYGLSGLTAELIGHVVLDPLNVMPRAESATIRGLGEMTGNKAIVLGWSGKQGLGIFGGYKNYTALVKSGQVGVFGDPLTSFERSLAGLTERNILKDLDENYHVIKLKGEGERLHFANPALRWADGMLMLTPESRVEMLHVLGIDAYNASADRFRGDPDAWLDWHKTISESPAEGAAKFSTAAYGSPIYYSLQRAMKAFVPEAEKAVIDFHTKDVERTLLFGMSDVLGIKPDKILIRLGEPNGAQGLFDEFTVKLTQSDHPNAPELLRQINDGAMTADDFVKIGEAFIGDDAVPWHPDQLMTNMSGVFNKTVADWAIKTYGAKETSFGFRFANTLKKAQSALLLSWNPAYFINNSMNNAVSRWATHIWGYSSGEHREQWYTRFGRRMARERAGLGAAATGVDLEIKGLSPSEAGQAIGKPMGEWISPEGERELRKVVNMNKGALGSVNRVLDFINRLGPATTGSRKAEVFESQNAMYFAAKKAWEAWESGKIISEMPPALRNDMIRLVGANAPEWFRNILRSSLNMDEVNRGILDTTPRYDISTSIIEKVVNEMNKGETDPKKLINADVVRDTLTSGQILDNLNRDLKGVTTAQGVRDAFAKARKTIEDNADQLNLNDLTTRANQVWATVASGKWLELFNLANEKNNKISEFEAKHYVEMDAVRSRDEAYRASDEPDYGAIRRNWEESRKQSNRQRQRIRKFELAADDGIYKGMGLGDEKVKTYNDTVQESYTLWDKFWAYENNQKDTYFKNRKKMNKAEAEAEWANVKERISKKYRQTQRLVYGYSVTKNGVETHRPGVMDRANKVFLDAVQATYGKDAHRVAKKWIEETAKINIELDEMMTDQRNLIDTLPQNQKRRVWQIFLDEEYLPKMRDLYNNNTNEMVALYRTITGQPPPKTKQAPVVEIGKKPPAAGEAPPTGGEPTPPPAGPEAPPTAPPAAPTTQPPEAGVPPTGPVSGTPEKLIEPVEIDYEPGPPPPDEFEPQAPIVEPAPTAPGVTKRPTADVRKEIIKTVGDIEPDFVYTKKTGPTGEPISRNVLQLTKNIMKRVDNLGGIEGIKTWNDLVDQWDTVKPVFERMMRRHAENAARAVEISARIPTPESAKDLNIAERLRFEAGLTAIASRLDLRIRQGENYISDTQGNIVSRTKLNYPDWYSKYNLDAAEFPQFRNGKKLPSNQNLKGVAAINAAIDYYVKNGTELLYQGKPYKIFNQLKFILEDIGIEGLVKEAGQFEPRAFMDALAEQARPFDQIVKAGELWQQGLTANPAERRRLHEQANTLLADALLDPSEPGRRLTDDDWVKIFGSSEEAKKAFNYEVQQKAKDAGLVVDLVEPRPNVELTPEQQVEYDKTIEARNVQVEETVKQVMAQNEQLKAELKAERERRIQVEGYDDLTGLRIYNTAKPGPEGLMDGYAFIDMAGLKYLNDNYGHTTGDALLFAVAEVARENNIPLQRIGRGGDEFIIATGSVHEASRLADILDKKLREMPFLVEKPDGSYTMVYGYGIRYGTGDTYVQADKAHNAIRTEYYKNHPAVRKYLREHPLELANAQQAARSSIFPGATVVDIPAGGIESGWVRQARKPSVSEVDAASQTPERTYRIAIAREEYRDRFRKYVTEQTDPDQSIPYSGELEPAPVKPPEIQEGALYRYLRDKPRENEAKMTKTLQSAINEKNNTFKLKGENPTRWEAYQELARHNGYELDDYTYDTRLDTMWGGLKKLPPEEVAATKVVDLSELQRKAFAPPEPGERITPFKYQNTHAEPIISHRWKGDYGNEFRFIMENAGDMFRELSKYGEDGFADKGYIREKLNRVLGYLLLDDTYRKNAMENNPEDFAKLKEAYTSQTYIGETQKHFLDMIHNLLDGDKAGAVEKANYINDNLETMIDTNREAMRSWGAEVAKPVKKVEVIEPMTDPDAALVRMHELNLVRVNEHLPENPESLTFIRERIPGASINYTDLRPATEYAEAVRGIRITRNGVNLDVQLTENINGILMNWIISSKPGSGLGSDFMEAMRQYANLKHKRFEVYKITNPDFYAKFDWLNLEQLAEDKVVTYEPWKAAERAEQPRLGEFILDEPIEMPNAEDIVPAPNRIYQGQASMFAENAYVTVENFKYPLETKIEIDGRSGTVKGTDTIEHRNFYNVEYDDMPGFYSQVEKNVLEEAMRFVDFKNTIKKYGYNVATVKAQTINGEECTKMISDATGNDIAVRPESWDTDPVSGNNLLLGYDPEEPHDVIYMRDGEIKTMPAIGGGSGDVVDHLNTYLSRSKDVVKARNEMLEILKDAIESDVQAMAAPSFKKRGDGQPTKYSILEMNAYSEMAKQLGYKIDWEILDRGARGKLTKIETPAVEGIAAFITRSMKQQLADLGYNKQDISGMTGAQANDIITNNITKPKAAPAAEVPPATVPAGFKPDDTIFVDGKKFIVIEMHTDGTALAKTPSGVRTYLSSEQMAKAQSELPVPPAGGAVGQPPLPPKGPTAYEEPEAPPPPGGSNNIAGDIPPGVVEQLNPVEFRSELEGDLWKKSTEPVVNALEERMVTDGPTEGFKIPPEMMPAVNKYLRRVSGDMETAKAYTTAYANTMRDYALLNYSMRRGVDNWLNIIYPYQFWYTRTALNWAMRAFDRPAWYANYYRFRKFMKANREEYGFPTRMKNKIGILAPYLPDWTGDKFYVDPLNNIFPFENFITPMAQYASLVNENEREAEYLLKSWAEEGTISDSEAMTASQSHEGDLWQQAMDTVKGEQDWSPVGFMDWVMSPALYLTIPWYLITGKTMSLQPREDLPLLPMTRTGNAVKAVTEGSPLGSLGNVVGTLMAAPEKAFRKAVGMSEFGDWGNYYIDRQIANMVGEGVCNLREAQLAMIEREGPVYSEALRRTMLEQSFKVPGSLPTYAALNTDWQKGKIIDQLGEMGAAVIFGLAPAGLLPEAELEARQLKDEYQAARRAYNGGDTQAMDRFFEDYPEYEARSGLFLEPEQRLREFLITDIWNKWGEMGKVDKEQMQASFGDEFQNNFLDDETRNYDLIKDETLAFWSNQMLNYVPKTITPVEPQGYTEMPVVPEQMQAEVDAYKATRDANFPNWYAMQERYYQLPPGPSRKAFLAQYPMLKDYWDWNKAYKETHPNIEEYQNTYEPPYYDYSFLTEFTQPLYKQLLQHYLNGVPISSGALAELNRIWKDSGQGDSFNEFIYDVVKPLLSP